MNTYSKKFTINSIIKSITYITCITYLFKKIYDMSYLSNNIDSNDILILAI